MSRHVAYARFYNTLYAKGKNKASSWIRVQLNPSNSSFYRRVRITKHMNTMIRTQHIRAWIDEPTLDHLNCVTRLAHIGCMMRLRTLQRYIIRYLWRPNGNLMHANGRALVTSMRGEA